MNDGDGLLFASLFVVCSAKLFAFLPVMVVLVLVLVTIAVTATAIAATNLTTTDYWD